MAKHEVLIGQTDYTVLVFIPDSASTDGSGKTGLVAANLTVSGTRVETDNDVVVTDYTSSLNNLAALTTAHTDWGLLEVSSTLAPGLYRLDIADAIFASGAWSAVVYVMVTTSAAAASPMEFVLVPTSPINGVTAAVLTGHTVQTGDSYAIVSSGTHGNAALKTLIDTLDDFVDTEVAAIKAKTDNLPSDPADASDIATSFTTVNTKLDTIDDFLDTEIAAIKAKTDNLPADPADASDVAGAFTTVNTKLDTIDDFLDTEVAAIKAKTDSLTFTVAGKVDANVLYLNGDATSAANIAKTTRAIGRGTVDAGSSTTSIVTSACTPDGAAADQFKGRIITFDATTATEALQGQATDITASSNAAAPTFTVTALTTAPASGDTFSIT